VSCVLKISSIESIRFSFSLCCDVFQGRKERMPKVGLARAGLARDTPTSPMHASQVKRARARCAILYGREPTSCLDRVFNFKLDSFASYQHKHTPFVQPFLELKTRPWVCPARWSLSMARVLKNINTASATNSGLTGQNLGRVFNSKSWRYSARRLLCCVAKRSSLNSAPKVTSSPAPRCIKRFPYSLFPFSVGILHVSCINR
jgi:hypothetical protein